MNSVSFKNFDVVLMHGPPFVGKNKFCLETLSQTHKIIYPRVLYKDNSRFGIRDVALEAYTKIKEGHKVVILDTNENRKTRESYIRLLKKKVGEYLRVATISILPKYGCQQLLWSREFCRAQWSKSDQMDADMNDNHDDAEEETILKWFEKSTDLSVTYQHGIVDEVRDTEGSTVHHMTHGLQAVSTYKFELPVLFIQWECISYILEEEDEGTDKLLTGITAVFNHWSGRNPQGRIIVVCDGSQIKTGEKSCTQQIREIKEVLTRIVTSGTGVPVYVHHIEKPGTTESYTLPPQPGILAYLQHRHCLNLTAKNTLYIYESATHKKLAVNAGVRHVKAFRLIKQPSLVNIGHIATVAAIPDMLQHMTLLPEAGEPTGPRIPLYNGATEFRDHYIYSTKGTGRSEYLFAQDWNTVERFQEVYSRKAKQIHEPESLISMSEIPASLSDADIDTSVISETSHTERDLPKWMMSKEKSFNSKPSLNSSLSFESLESEKKVRKSVYVMTEKELVDVATDILKQAGKLEVLDHHKHEKENRAKTKQETSTPKGKVDLQKKPHDNPHPDLLDTPTSLFDREENGPGDYEETQAKTTAVILKRQTDAICDSEYAPSKNKKTKYADGESSDIYVMETNVKVKSGEFSRVDRAGKRETTNVRQCKSHDTFNSQLASDTLDEFLDTKEIKKPSPKKHTQHMSTTGKMAPSILDIRSPAPQQNKKSSRQSPDLSVLDDIFL